MMFLAFLLAAQLAKPQPPGLIAFMKATGYPHGRPGFVVDHKIPVCAGGDPNDANNLQWQEKAASYRKDVCERALCKEMKRQGYRLVKVEQK